MPPPPSFLLSTAVTKKRSMVLVLMMMMMLSARTTSGIECLGCHKCKDFEISSQSVKCGEGVTKCLTADLKMGEVYRACASEADCRMPEAEMSKRNYLTLNCCEGDLCNGASDIRAKVVVMLGLILVARMF